MPPRQQHTFTLVPNPLGMQGLLARSAAGTTAGAPQSKPPMTSKQAQKLYKQANRRPRLSKAEQRRIEREEQERIRRELDHDKQLARARTLREKKKAKEQQVLDEKRKRGLPLVDVRPSQDTISRFVRGNGAGKKRDSVGAKVELPVVVEEDDGSNTEDGLEKEDLPKQSKKLCAEAVNASPKSTTVTRTAAPSEGSQDRAADTIQPRARSRERDKENIRPGASRQGSVGYDDISAEKLSPKPPNARLTWKEAVQAKQPATPLPVAPQPVAPQPAAPQPAAPQPVAPQPARPSVVMPTKVQTPPQLPVTKQHSLATPISARQPLKETPNSLNRHQPPGRVPKQLASRTPLLANPNQRSTSPGLPAFKQPAADTPVTRSQKKPTFSTPRNHASAVRGQHQGQQPLNNSASTLPTSTQLFIMTHIDDLFPSPSQEAREIQEASRPIVKPPVPTSKQPAVAQAGPQRFLKPPHPNTPMGPPPRPITNARKQAEATPIPFISTQDLFLSTQDLHDLGEPAAARKTTGGSSNKPPPFKKALPPTPQQRPPPPSWSSSAHGARHATPQFRMARPSPPVRFNSSTTCTAGVPSQKAEHRNKARKPDPIQDEKPSDKRKAGPASRQGELARAENCPSGHQTTKPADKPPLSEPEPEKPRFFGSSGSGVELLLALDRSKKTHEEETRKRRVECGQQQGSEKRALPESASVAAASQETDYGDLDIDATDLDELEFRL